MTATASHQGRRHEPQRPPDVRGLLDQPMPHAIEAEMSLLGAMILDSQVIGDVAQILASPEDFYRAQHAAIYRVLTDLYNRNLPIDLVHLNQKLRDQGVLEQIGGTAYLVQLAEAVPSSVGAVHYAQIVHDKSVLRKLIETSQEVLHRAYTSADEVIEQVDAAENAVFKLRRTNDSGDASGLGELLQETYAKLEAQDGKFLTGLDTGYEDLNKLTSGLQKGEMIIVAGRPSMGKTAFAVNIAEHIAVVNRQPVGIFSLEMSKQQLAQRLLCSYSRVDSQKLRSNMLNGEEWGALQLAVGELHDAPMFIDDSPGLTIMGLRARARRMARRHDIAILFIDYLQLMSSGGNKSNASREQEVSEISRGVKALARELDIPIVCLSQLNRGAESREGHRPRMSDLRESGAIEQDADVIMLLHREEYYHRSDPDWRDKNPDKVGLAECIVAKQRNGPTDTVDLQFNEGTTRFENRYHQHHGGGGGSHGGI